MYSTPRRRTLPAWQEIPPAPTPDPLRFVIRSVQTSGARIRLIAITLAWVALMTGYGGFRFGQWLCTPAPWTWLVSQLMP